MALRQLHEQIDNSMLQAAFRAVQIVAWDETHRYCGTCGEATIKKNDEHAKVCPECGHIDDNEIADARWFSVEEIPKIPGKLSISRKLIDWFIEKYQK